MVKRGMTKKKGLWYYMCELFGRSVTIKIGFGGKFSVSGNYGL